jgi:hypothetical protein
MSEAEVDEVQLAEVLYSMLVRASELLSGDYLEEAAAELDEVEGLMENIKQQGGHIDNLLVLMVLQNKACVSQRLGQDLQCAAYLEACAFNLKTEQLSSRSAGTKQRLERIRTRRNLTRTLLQMAVVHSKAGRHQAALDKARGAWREFNQFLKDSLQLCEQQSQAHSKLTGTQRSKPQYEISESPHYQEAILLIQKAKPIYEYLYCRLVKNTPARKPELTSRSALGVLDYTSTFFTADIASVAMIQPMSVGSLSINLTFKRELSQEALHDAVRLIQVVLGIGVYYCLATELHLSATDLKSSEVDAKLLHWKIFEVAEDLLPAESPLVEHLKGTYTLHFGKTGLSHRSSRKHLEPITQRSRSPAKLTREGALQTSYRSTSSRLKKRPQGGVSPGRVKSKIRPKFVSPEKSQISTEKLLKDIESMLKLSTLPSPSGVLSDSTRKPSKTRQPESTPRALEPAELKISSSDLYGLYSSDEEDRD